MCWCSCPASAKSATPQRRCENLKQHRGAAALRAAADSRAAEDISAAHRPARRARHQRRRDVADRARHPLRRRPRHRADLAVQPPDEGAAAADRADLAGLCRAARGPLGSRRAGRVHPPVLRGGLRLAAPAHRPRDPADQPRRRHPADGRAATRRHRELPVPRSARQAQHPRRCAAAAGARRLRPRRRDHRPRPPPRAAARRPAAGPDDPSGRHRGMRARSAGARGRAVDSRPEGAARRPRGGRAPEARPVRRRALGLHLVPEPVALPARATKRTLRQRVSADVSRGVPALPAHPRVAGSHRAAA